MSNQEISFFGINIPIEVIRNGDIGWICDMFGRMPLDTQYLTLLCAQMIISASQSDWIGVSMKPPPNMPVAVRTHGTSWPALALWTGEQWKVQPMFTAWYVTDSLVRSWRYIGILDENEE